MFSLCIWNTESHFKTLSFAPAEHPICIGLTSDFILISTPATSIQRFEFPQIAQPVHFPLPETVIQISCNTFMALLLTDHSVWLLGRDTAQSGLFGSEELTESQVPVHLKLSSENPFISASLSDRHAAVVCAGGLLYTWGEGGNGELGRIDLQKTSPMLVSSASIFKATQVITGLGFTAIITEGGYLYIYSKAKECQFGSTAFYPYTIPEFESLFIVKAVRTGSGIAVLTSSGKVFVTKGCLCTQQLVTNKKIGELAASVKKISALSKDKSRIYVWDVEFGENKQVFEVKGKVFALFSGAGDVIGMSGEGLEEFPGEEYGGYSPPEASPKFCEQDKKEIMQLLGRYSFRVCFSQESVLKKEACKDMVHCLTRYMAEGFRKIKEFGYVQKMIKRVYVNSLILNSLVKVWNRTEEILKKFAFGKLSKCEKYGFGREKEVRALESLKILIKKKKSKFFLKVLKAAAPEFYFKSCGESLKVIQSLLCVYFMKIQKNSLNPVLVLEKLFYLKAKQRVFTNWSYFLKPRKLFYHIKRVLDKKMHAVLSLIFSDSAPNTQLKYGFHFLVSSISKLQTKQKSYSFNSILRQKSKLICVEHFGERFQVLLRPLLSHSFHQIRLKCITQKHTKIIRLILSAQSVFEKLKYRMIIKGFNAFKKNSFNKSLLSDMSSEKSFGTKNFCKTSHPRCESSSLEMTMPNTERSTFEISTTSNIRHASLHTCQQKLSKKHSEKLLPDPKTKPDKYKSKESRLDKRLAYHEALKERQRKKMQNKVYKPISHFNVDSFDTKNWISNKYQTASEVLVKVLISILISKTRLPFNFLKYHSKGVQGRSIEKERKILEKNGKELKIKTKYLELPRIGVKVYESPVMSPIALVGEDNFLQRTSFDIISPKFGEESQPSLWKIKLYTLGMKRFVKACKMMAGRRVLMWLGYKS